MEDNTPDPAEVAGVIAGLTKAQVAAMLAAKQGAREKQPWINIGMARATTAAALNRSGLIDYHDLPARLTPLGLAVRAQLQSEGSPDAE